MEQNDVDELVGRLAAIELMPEIDDIPDFVADVRRLLADVDTLRAQFAELGDKTERQYFDGVEVGMAIAAPSAYDYDAMRARVAFLERAGHDAANEARIAHSRIADALVWYANNSDDLRPSAAANLFAILTGGRLNEH